MPVKMVVFDMAGTTVSDQHFVADAFQNALKKQGIHLTMAEIQPLMGYEKKFAIRMMLKEQAKNADVDANNERKIETIYNDFIREMIDFYEYSPQVRPAEGAEEVFNDLKEKSIVIALNTGFPKNIADTIVNRFQWIEKGLVDDYIASNEVEKGRPYPFMIEQLMYRAGIDDPMLVAKVGDTAVDVEEGKNVGCGYVIAITTGAYKTTELERSEPTHIVNSLREISSILM